MRNGIFGKDKKSECGFWASYGSKSALGTNRGRRSHPIKSHPFQFPRIKDRNSLRLDVVQTQFWILYTATDIWHYSNGTRLRVYVNEQTQRKHGETRGARKNTDVDVRIICIVSSSSCVSNSRAVPRDVARSCQNQPRPNEMPAELTLQNHRCSMHVFEVGDNPC